MTRTHSVSADPEVIMLRSLILLVALVLTMCSCTRQQPSTVVPAAPRITSFTASTTSLTEAGAVTLSWATENATRVQLTGAGGQDLSVAQDTTSGSLQVQVDASSVFVLVARGEGGTEARALSITVGPQAGRTLTLVALPALIAGGDSTTLVWTAPGASSLTLLAGTEPVDTQGQLASGAVVVRPSRDTVYTLSDGTQSATASVSVQVALLSLDVSPASARVGEPLTLSWTTAGADSVVIEALGRGELANITDLAQVSAGQFDDVVPPLPDDGLMTYVVSAVRGNTRMSRTISAFVGSQLSIARLEASSVARANAPYRVRWTTIAAERVQVVVEGQEVYETPTAQLAANGVFTFTAPAADFELELVALDARGSRVSQRVQIDVVGVPTGATLTATPSSITAGQSVTLTFAAAETRRARITDDQGLAVYSVSGEAAESGSITLTPRASATYTLSADNQLGDPAVTASATVTVTGAGPGIAQFPPTALHGQQVELRPTTSGAQLYGFPHGTVLSSTLSNFEDISATGERVLEQGADVVTVTPNFSTRLWGERREGALTISRAGWMAWGAPLTVNASETSLPSVSASAMPGLIAPYWDDLRLVATSVVLMQVVGEAPEQRLIVQWDGLQVGTDPDTLVTFQAQVHQQGVVSFHYRTMTFNAAPTFTVGLQDSTRQLGFDELGTEPPASNTALYFFSPVVVAPSVRVALGSSWGGFLKTGASYDFVGQQSRVVRAPYELAVSELMFRPAPLLAAGQYVELTNFTNAPLDLTGWSLRGSDGSSFSLPSGTTVNANTQLLVGASVDATDNDDAGVTVSWSTSGFALFADAGAFTLGTDDAGVGFTYSGPPDAGRGMALEIDPGPFVSTGASTPVSMSCWATTSFGAQLGSPGRVQGCGFRYQREGIDNRFHDISQSGTELLGSQLTPVTNQLFTVTLAATGSDPAPLLFGVRTPSLTVASNGWFSPRVITATGPTNKTVPNATEPFGTVAPFWDALEALPNVSSMQWQKFEPNEDPQTPQRHWILQWTKLNTVSAADGAADELTFQAKLFENGDLEFHYATMRSGSTADFALGASATVWVEEPTGTRALIVSANARAPRDHTSIRFVAR